MSRYTPISTQSWHPLSEVPSRLHAYLATRNPRIGGHRPAATVLLTSVAQIYGKNSVGVILTGMGADGAAGIAEIKQAGGKTIAQDGQSCVVFGMPKVAIEMGVVDRVLPVEQIAQGIIDFTME